MAGLIDWLAPEQAEDRGTSLGWVLSQMKWVSLLHTHTHTHTHQRHRMARPQWDFIWTAWRTASLCYLLNHVRCGSSFVAHYYCHGCRSRESSKQEHCL